MSQSAKASRVGQIHVFTKELQLPVTMQVLQFFEEATPEQPRQHPHREEEPRLARHPAVGIGREAAAGYDAVHMRMMSQGRAPGVQHQGGADPGTQVLRIGGDRAQGLGGDVEQQTIEDLLVGVGDGADGRGQGEHHVVIRHGQQVRLPCFEPALRRRCSGTSGSAGCGTSCRRSAARRTTSSAAHGRRRRRCGTVRWPT